MEIVGGVPDPLTQPTAREQLTITGGCPHLTCCERADPEKAAGLKATIEDFQVRDPPVGCHVVEAARVVDHRERRTRNRIAQEVALGERDRLDRRAAAGLLQGGCRDVDTGHLVPVASQPPRISSQATSDVHRLSTTTRRQ